MQTITDDFLNIEKEEIKDIVQNKIAVFDTK